MTGSFCSRLASITALGAGGGAGVRNTEKSLGGYVHGLFNLTAGEKIYILVGQKGESACDSVSSLSCHFIYLFFFVCVLCVPSI